MKKVFLSTALMILMCCPQKVAAQELSFHSYFNKPF
jgi:hypothetical protein